MIRRRPTPPLLAVLLTIPLALHAGCASPSGPYQPAAGSGRDTARAASLTTRAADSVLENPDHAERLLREALTADLYHGPAHNNLGVIFLNRGMLYEAANEFEWARKLMPGHPDPRLNLALTLERAGRVDDAIEAYHAALEVHPDHLPSIMGLTRAQVRHDRTNERTAVMLEELVMRAPTPEWQRWAERQLLSITSR